MRRRQADVMKRKGDETRIVVHQDQNLSCPQEKGIKKEHQERSLSVDVGVEREDDLGNRPHQKKERESCCDESDLKQLSGFPREASLSSSRHN